MSTTSRQSDYDIHSLFIQRWSPRAYTGEAIPNDVLFAAFEAARWAPSSGNAQPWRFLYSKKDSSTWTSFLDLLNPNNRRWASNASALVVVISKKTTGKAGEVTPSKTHSFDSGAAWQSFALQAIHAGWHTHGIGGFDRDKARTTLKVPDDFAVEAVIAIGKQGDKSVLPPELQEREAPNTRLPLKELVLEGAYQSV